MVTTQHTTASAKNAKPYRKSEFALHRMRTRLFDYDETPKEAQATRVLLYLKARVIRQRRLDRLMAACGPYSGLSRRELAATGTCETDWV